MDKLKKYKWWLAGAVVGWFFLGPLFVILLIIVLLIYKKSGYFTESNNESLSNKYKILRVFQWIIGLFTIASIIYTIIEINKNSKYMDSLAWGETIVGLCFHVFSSLCLILIIQFLFDLDKTAN